MEGEGRVQPPIALARPSEILKSKDVLEAGASKQIEFCVSFCKYSLGVKIMAHVASVLERNAQDILADKSLAYVQDHFKTIGGNSMMEDLPDRSGIEDATKFQPVAEEAAPKLIEALVTWSAARLEERWEDVQECIAGCVHVHRHGAAVLAKAFLHESLPIMRKASKAALATTHFGNPEDDQQEHMKSHIAMGELFGSLWTSLAEARSKTASLRNLIHSSIEATMAMLQKLVDLNLLPPAVGQGFKASVNNSEEQVRLWMHVFVSMCSGGEGLYGIATKDFGQYPENWDKCAQTEQHHPSAADIVCRGEARGLPCDIALRPCHRLVSVAPVGLQRRRHAVRQHGLVLARRPLLTRHPRGGDLVRQKPRHRLRQRVHLGVPTEPLDRHVYVGNWHYEHDDGR